MAPVVMVATIIIIITHICKLVVLRYCNHTPLGNECPDASLKFRMWDVGTLVFLPKFTFLGYGFEPWADDDRKKG